MPDGLDLVLRGWLRSEEEALGGWFDSLRSLFRGEKAGRSEKELKRMATEAVKASPGARWTVFNRLGDAYLKAGDQPRALRYFGKAIDALLEDDQPEPARAVAKKVIRLHPDAIRPLCTLTWLDLASMKVPAAISSLQEYVQAAKSGRVERLACGQIVEMARLSAVGEFLEAVAVALEDLGCAADAAEVRKWIEPGRGPSAPEDNQELHALCMKAAIGSNQKLKTKGALA